MYFQKSRSDDRSVTAFFPPCPASSRTKQPLLRAVCYVQFPPCPRRAGQNHFFCGQCVQFPPCPQGAGQNHRFCGQCVVFNSRPAPEGGQDKHRPVKAQVQALTCSSAPNLHIFMQRPQPLHMVASIRMLPSSFLVRAGQPGCRQAPQWTHLSGTGCTL